MTIRCTISILNLASFAIQAACGAICKEFISKTLSVYLEKKTGNLHNFMNTQVLFHRFMCFESYARP